jgi:hypothetical protein
MHHHLPHPDDVGHLQPVAGAVDASAEGLRLDNLDAVAQGAGQPLEVRNACRQ